MLRALEAGASAYGVTTGLGYMSTVPIAPEDRAALQRSILLGRSVGVGEPLPREVVRGAMLLRLTGFLSGDAGVSSELCRAIAAALAAALTGASSRPFSTRIGRLKGDPGQLRVHERLVELLCDWSDRPQAPVSLRVVPQVHGAVLDVLDGMEAQLEREVRAV